MGLIMNTYRESSIPATHFGGIIYSAERFNFFRQENFYCMNAGSAGILKSASIPWGVRPPICFRLAMGSGGLASNTKIIGSGSVVGTRTYAVAILANLTASGGISSALASMGMELLANITGSGSISSAVAQLLAQIQASLTGSGTIENTPILAYLNALANITGTGEITSGDLYGLGELIALLDGVGLISTTLIANGELNADIKAYGSLTPEGIRDSIWNAVASTYNISGTMGQKLNSAAVGGVDYEDLAEAVLDAEISGRAVGSLGRTVEDTKKKANMIPGLY